MTNERGASLTERIGLAADRALSEELGKRGLSIVDVAGCALVTDDDLASLSLAVAMESDAESSLLPGFRFRPNEWGEATVEPFTALAAEMSRAAWEGPPRPEADDERRVNDTFNACVEALVRLRKSRGFRPTAFLTVHSSDPGTRLVALEEQSIPAMNDESVVRLRSEHRREAHSRARSNSR